MFSCPSFGIMQYQMTRSNMNRWRTLLIVLVAVLLSNINMFASPVLMNTLENAARSSGMFLRVVDAQPPNVGIRDGVETVHPLTVEYRIRVFLRASLFTIFFCIGAGTVLGSVQQDSWLRDSIVFSIAYSFGPFLLNPVLLLVFFLGFDAATPLGIWLDHLQSLVILAVLTLGSAWTTQRIRRRRNPKAA